MVTQRGAKRVNVAATPAGRDHLLRVLLDEAAGFFDLVIDADDASWHASTPCEGWEVRDIVGHMVQGTETYLDQYAIALEGKPAADPLGLRGYAKDLFEGALEFREVSHAELVHRLKTAWDRLNQVWNGLADEQWAGLNIPHKYAGPVPQFMMVVFQLLDYTFHTWDIKKALGQPAHLGDEAAGTLVPFMVMLQQFCFAPERAEGLDFALGIDIDGPYGGTWQVTVKDQQIGIEEGELSECQATLQYQDAQEFCLAAYGRTQSGQISGDSEVVQRYQGLFFGL
ncbi:MAG: maleylpyruvate isomerase family mycothiol-dependent enzyme [Dehalococcoidia bacterium]